MRDLLLILSAPSGAGKSTLARALLDAEPNFALSTSHTTRPPRPGETPGLDYHFVSEAEFACMGDAGEFAEWAEVHGHRYGTSNAEVDRLLASGRDVLFDVDYQGARALMRRYPEAVSVFVIPPSMADLKVRLLRRGTETAADLGLRLQDARIDLAAAGEYQYVVVNDEREHAVEDLRAIVRAARMRARCQAGRVKALAREAI
jgi:guanylate kinase